MSITSFYKQNQDKKSYKNAKQENIKYSVTLRSFIAILFRVAINFLVDAPKYWLSKWYQNSSKDSAQRQLDPEVAPGHHPDCTYCFSVNSTENLQCIQTNFEEFTSKRPDRIRHLNIYSELTLTKEIRLTSKGNHVFFIISRFQCQSS